jgi:hypothetical protein
MGLDGVEFVLAIEGAFGIDIPDSDVVALETPRLLADYLSERLRTTASPQTPACLSQRAFYKARAAAALRFGQDRRALRPDTNLSEVLGRRRDEWVALGDDIQASQWPRLKGAGWRAALSGGVATFSELAHHLAVYDAAAMRPPDTPWSRNEIEQLVATVLEVDLGVNMSKFSLDSRFVRDMRID